MASAEKRIQSLERRYYTQQWLYLGTWIAKNDPGNDPPEATFDSPPYQNLFYYDAPVALSVNSEGSLDWIGILSYEEGFTGWPQIVATIPSSYIPDDDDRFYSIPMVGWYGGEIIDAWLEVDTSTGDVWAYPKEAAPLAMKLFADQGTGSAVVAGDNRFVFAITEDMAGMTLHHCAASVSTASSSGDIEVMVRNRTTAADMLTSPIEISSGQEFGANFALNEAEAIVQTGDIIALDVDSAGTGAIGLAVYLRFEYRRPTTGIAVASFGPTTSTTSLTSSLARARRRSMASVRRPPGI
jgi:hypothetical protein